MNLAQSSIKLFLANVVGAGLQFLGITFFARELGASQIGVFFLFQALLGMLAIPADFGLRGAVEKRISEGEAPGKFLSSVIVLKVAPIFTIVLGILLLRPWINNYIGADVAVYLALALLLQEAAQLAVFVLKGELRVGETAVLKIAQQATWVGGGAIFVGYGFKAEAMIYSLLAGLGVMLIWGWYKSSVSLRRPSVTHARSLLDYGRYNVISSIGGYFYSWMDVAIIGLFLMQAHVGAYEVAWRVSAITILLSSAIATSMFPQISAWNSTDATTRIENAIPHLLIPSLLFVIPAFFGTVLYSREILGLVFGNEYTIAWLVLIILMLEKVTQSVHVVLGRMLQAIDRPDLAAKATIVGVSLNLLLNIPLVWKFGIVGAAVATTFASFVGGVLLHTYYLNHILTIRIPYREITECIIASIGMFLTLLLFSQFFIVNTLIALLISISTGVVLYTIFIMLSPSLRVIIIEQSRRLYQSAKQ